MALLSTTLLLLVTPLAQIPAAAEQTPSIDELTAAVRKFHRGKGAPKVVTSFEGTLRVTRLNAEKDDFTISLDVRYLADPLLIRYKIEEQSGRLQRGRDKTGYWTRIRADEVPQDLGQREYATERAQVQRELRLARQLVRFLEPAELIAQLEEPLIRPAELVTGGKKVSCYMVSGTHPSFPLYMTDGLPGEVFLTLWIDASDHSCRAVQAFPIGGNRRVSLSGELIEMPEHHRLDGLLLPIKMVFHRIQRGTSRIPEVSRAPEVTRIAEVKVEIMNLDLNPDLKVQNFDRDELW